MWHYFADKRYRNERLLLVFGVPLAILALAGVIFLLVSQESSLQKPVSILTADQIEPTEEAAPEAKRASIEEVIKLFDEGKDADALTLIKSPNGPPPAQVKAFLAGRAALVGNAEEADRLINEAIDLDPQSSYFRIRGDFHRERGRPDEAMADYEEALSLNPSDVIASNRRLLVMIEKGQTDLVRKMIQLRIDLGVSSQAELWLFGAAAVELQLQSSQGAANFLRTATTLVDPSTFDLLLADPLFAPYQNDPAILPFFIKTSSARTDTR